jgi:hypothetical protein
MALKTKNITEHCPHITFKIHWKRTTFPWRRTADLYSHKNETVLHQWFISCGSQANFNPRHLTMYPLEPLIPCDSNEHQRHRNLESIKSFALSNPKLWSFYRVRHANVLRQKIVWMKLRISLHRFLLLLLNVELLQSIRFLLAREDGISVVVVRGTYIAPAPHIKGNLWYCCREGHNKQVNKTSY